LGTAPDFQSIALLAFWTVFLAELVGDKSLYALTSLALRYRLRVLYGAFAVASAGKMAIAVVLGSTLIRFQSRWTDVISAVAFFVSAVLIWTGERDESSQAESPPTESPPTESSGKVSSRGGLAWCGIFFLSEWADPGQIAAAALALKSHALAATWIGATSAMLLKGAVALTLGLQLRDRLPQRTLQGMASASCCVLGILASRNALMA
jgi:putative Ca2+/H+ antiporter (TMEM165/GDT1 family)